MSKKTFKAELLSGHKDHAVEVLFDPSIEWNLQPRSLWRGRRGFPVRATIDGISFESAVVPRQKKFYLLIDAEAAKTAGVSPGAIVKVDVEPYAE